MRHFDRLPDTQFNTLVNAAYRKNAGSVVTSANGFARSEEFTIFR